MIVTVLIAVAKIISAIHFKDFKFVGHLEYVVNFRDQWTQHKEFQRMKRLICEKAFYHNSDSYLMKPSYCPERINHHESDVSTLFTFSQ